MFNFNFDLSALADWYDSSGPAQLAKELEAIASVATVTAVNSPAVVSAPTNTAPPKAEVQAVVNQVIEAVAPVVAPSVPRTFISKLEPIIAEEVVSNPKVISSPAGATIAPSATNAIASSISSTFKNDAQKDAELAAAVKQAASTPLAPVTQPGTTATTTAKPDAVNLPFDTTKPATSITMPFDTTKPATTVNLTTTATTTPVANIQKVENFAGDGTKARPLFSNGNLFTGNRNGIEYKDGLAVNATRADILEANRNAAEAAETAKRAATNPLFDPTNRPQGTIDKGFIVYYSWIGGRTNGEWREYRAPVTPENMAKYGSRVFPGSTQATFENVAGAGALDVQPMPTYDKDGNITGYTLGGTTLTTSGLTRATTSGATTGTTTTGTTTTGTTTTGTTTGGATTGVTTGGVTTGVTTSGVITGVTTSATTTGGFTGGFGGSTTTAVTTTPITSVTSPTTNMGRESIIKTLQDRFAKYGLSSLANKIRDLAIEGATEATITLQLQETPEYIQRFGANQTRIKAGLAVLTPAEYLNLEDGYRQVLRAYGLRQFDNDAYVQQFIANDMSPAELSNRVVTAVQRVQNADPAITRQLRDFYGIGTNDLVAYVLDPQQQFQKIERQVAAAEIGAAARLQGFDTGVTVAEQLAAQGVTQAEARRGYSTIADILPTAEKLSQIYSGQEEAYGLAEAEQEVFNSLAEAQRRRTRLAQRELAQFSGTSGISRVGLTESRAGQF